MRILHIADFGVRRLNGISEVLLNLSKQQRILGNDVDILLIRKNLSYISDPHIHIRENISTQIRLVRRIDPDVVIFHSLYKWQYPLLGAWLRKKTIPYLIEMHGGSSIANSLKSKKIKQFANILAYNRFVNYTTSIIYLNENEQAQSIFRQGIIIPNGVYLPETMTIYRKQPKATINLLYLGRIDLYHKGLDLLIAAARKVKKENIQMSFSLKIYGYRYDDTILHLEEENKDVFEYHDAVYGQEKIEVLQSSDIFILTSRSEGMPMSVLEALSFGKPCLVTPQTNIADIVRKNDAGWVTSGNVDAIAATIIHACDDFRKRHPILQKNARESVESYSWERIAADSIEKYRNVIDGIS